MAMMSDDGDSNVRVFRAADAYAIEVVRQAHRIGEDRDATLMRELRRTALGCGGALVAASASPPGSPGERRAFERARVLAVEGRYYLYLARRFGLLDTPSYRSLRARQDAALRELDALVGRPSVRDGPPVEGRAAGW